MLPLFRSDEGALDEALEEVEAASLLEVLGQRPKDLVQHAFLGPTLEAPMAGLLRWVAFREARQGAPVRKTQSMPLSTSLGSRQGLPRPSARSGGLGIKGSKSSHCSSVRSTSTLRC